jgi:hypothetical protein
MRPHKNPIRKLCSAALVDLDLPWVELTSYQNKILFLHKIRKSIFFIKSFLENEEVVRKKRGSNNFSKVLQIARWSIWMRISHPWLEAISGSYFRSRTQVELGLLQIARALQTGGHT